MVLNPIPSIDILASHQFSTIYLNHTQTQTQIHGAQKIILEEREREEARERERKERRRSGLETRTSAKSTLPEAVVEREGP